jgi:hypothetical protein
MSVCGWIYKPQINQNLWGNSLVAEVVKLPLTRISVDPPFDTIEHAQVTLNQLEMAVELARVVLTKASAYGADEALRGCREVIAAGVTLAGFA